MNVPVLAPGGRQEIDLETQLQERIHALFGRCPTLNRFSVRDRSMLPDQLDPTALVGDIFVFEVSLYPRYGERHYDEVYGEIAAALHDAIRALPDARTLLPGRSFVRSLH
jgi:hypothetical protein